MRVSLSGLRVLSFGYPWIRSKLNTSLKIKYPQGTRKESSSSSSKTSKQLRRLGMKSKKIKRSETDILSEEDFHPDNVKIRISMFIPLSLQDAYRAEAEKLGIGYQTLMQIKLKEGLGKSPIEVRVERLEKAIFSRHG
jgi:hypothetical protein